MRFLPKDIRLAIYDIKHNNKSALILTESESIMDAEVNSLFETAPHYVFKCSKNAQDCPHRPCETHYPNYNTENK